MVWYNLPVQVIEPRDGCILYACKTREDDGPCVGRVCVEKYCYGNA